MAHVKSGAGTSKPGAGAKIAATGTKTQATTIKRLPYNSTLGSKNIQRAVNTVVFGSRAAPKFSSGRVARTK